MEYSNSKTGEDTPGPRGDDHRTYCGWEQTNKRSDGRHNKSTRHWEVWESNAGRQQQRGNTQHGLVQQVLCHCR